MDFINRLPSFQGHTVEVVIVDQFSKGPHFIPMPKLSFAEETVSIIMLQIILINGVLADIVSNRGPKFVPQFWKIFWNL